MENYNKSFHMFDPNFVFIFRAIAHKTIYGMPMVKHIDFVVFFMQLVVSTVMCR